jgi:hypothetical protein
MVRPFWGLFLEALIGVPIKAPTGGPIEVLKEICRRNALPYKRAESPCLQDVDAQLPSFAEAFRDARITRKNVTCYL